MVRQSSAVALLSTAAIRQCTQSTASRQRLAQYTRRTVVTDAKKADIAVLGGGLTGLTTTYYLAKKLPSTAKITLYESGDRLGGWIRTEKVPVDAGGKSGTVSFERGPRSLTSLSGNTFRFDDLVLYDLVRISLACFISRCSVLTLPREHRLWTWDLNSTLRP